MIEIRRKPQKGMERRNYSKKRELQTDRERGRENSVEGNEARERSQIRGGRGVGQWQLCGGRSHWPPRALPLWWFRSPQTPPGSTVHMTHFRRWTGRAFRDRWVVTGLYSSQYFNPWAGAAGRTWGLRQALPTRHGQGPCLPRCRV